MTGRIAALPQDVKASSAWPYEVMPQAKRPKVRGTGVGWVMAISVDPDLNGLYTYYPHGDGPQVLHFNNGTPWGKKVTTKPFYRVATKEEAEQFTIFCSMGHGAPSHELLPHQDGIFWGFNWCSLTTATVKMASRIADHFYNGRRDEAWALGRTFGDQIHAAENAAYDRLRSNA